MNSVWAIVARMFKDRKGSLMIFIGAGLAFLWLYVAIYPSVGGQADQFKQLYESYPESILKAFGIEQVNLSTFENFIAIEGYSLIWPMMLAIMVISMAAGMLTGEIERGTIELLLAKPISRLKLFFSRYLYGVLSTLIFTVVTVLAIWPLSKIHHVVYQLDRHVGMVALGMLLGLAIFSLAMLVAAIFSEKGKVAMITGGLLVVMYVLNIVASLKESWSDLKYASFFHYFDYQAVLAKGSINVVSVWVFVVVIVISTIVGALVWRKRDV
jgi:ABC-2 type transport system permease protein